MLIEIRPQKGPQEQALRSAADIVLMGGAKGGGKSYVMRLAPIRHLQRSGFHAVIFRRSRPQLTKPGGQWDKSYEIYPFLRGRPLKTFLKWVFPATSSITFSHLADEKDWLDWQGTETALFAFDQLEEFTQTQFLKILGCMRTTSGVRTQLWATMNPDADSWVRSLVDPWIAEDGYVDPSENGKIKYFTVIEDRITWVPNTWRDANGQPPKSIAYFTADIWDNPALLESDPDYLSSLQSQCLVDRERYLGIRGRGGNWNVKAVAGKVFKQEWFQVIDFLPAIAPLKQCRFWDLAATEKKQKGKDPDFTVGCKGLLYELGTQGKVLVIQGLTRGQMSPSDIDKAIVNLASQDGPMCSIRWEQEHGPAGIREAARMRSRLAGFDAQGILPYGDKVERSKSFSSGLEFGKVLLLRGDWNQSFINELVQFPDGAHDDQVDAGAGVYNVLMGTNVIRSSRAATYQA